jgi:molybdopterin/thiamine biosynthesis adenylyltransferase
VLSLEYKPFLNEGVDVYYDDNNLVTFVFLSTRKRIQVSAKKHLIKVLSYFDGNNTVEDILKAESVEREELHYFIQYLESKNILIDMKWFLKIPFDTNYKEKVKKQLFFLMDMLSSCDDVYKIQNKIKSTHVAIFGIGAVGGWILVELVKMGFERFKIIDHDITRSSDISRHTFFSDSNVGIGKVPAIIKTIENIDSNVSIEGIEHNLTTETNLDKLIGDVDIIINCAEEPYIGYTSIYLSRYVVKNNKLLFVAGGFDAHLASLGEMIVPYVTPCSDCYNNYFTKALKDWKPSKHPVEYRGKGMGGLISLNIFSASTACLSILKYFIAPDEFIKSANGRGEFKFDDYSIDSFTVKKDPGCRVCGNG